MRLSMTFALLFALVQGLATVASTAIHSTSLNAAARHAGKLYFGSATDNPELVDTAYLATLLSPMFGQLTPGNSMKWDATEPEQGVFDFSGGDLIVELAEKTGKITRGHNLVWHSQLPDWVMYGEWSPETLRPVLETHVRTEVSHYKGRIYAWDVVNEPLSDDGTMRENVFYETLGTSYINIALRTAHAADRHAKLYINDFNLEYFGPKIDEMVQLVEDLLADGVPIHGIGFESHFILGQISPSELKTNMERITALGLEVAITELDIRIQLPASDADLEQQRSEYMSVVQACMSVQKCVGVTVWDYTDRYSWIPSFFPGYGDPCPWNADLAPKPAYDGILEGFTSQAE